MEYVILPVLQVYVPLLALATKYTLALAHSQIRDPHDFFELCGLPHAGSLADGSTKSSRAAKLLTPECLDATWQALYACVAPFALPSSVYLPIASTLPSLPHQSPTYLDRETRDQEPELCWVSLACALLLDRTLVHRSVMVPVARTLYAVLLMEVDPAAAGVSVKKCVGGLKESIPQGGLAATAVERTLARFASKGKLVCNGLVAQGTLSTAVDLTTMAALCLLPDVRQTLADLGAGPMVR